jgi:hypothetical protein
LGYDYKSAAKTFLVAEVRTSPLLTLPLATNVRRPDAETSGLLGKVDLPMKIAITVRIDKTTVAALTALLLWLMS